MSNEPHGMGWVRDYPDFRDYTVNHNVVSSQMKAAGQRSVKDNLQKLGVLKAKAKSAPATVDLREWCSPIEDQGRIGSCTAQAAIGLVEYFERRAFGKHIDASRLFLYKVTRNLLGWPGDTGAYLRTTMGALVLFGAPPERYWSYTDEASGDRRIANFNEEPSAFCYAFAQNYRAISYYRLDPPGTSSTTLLNLIKTELMNGLPSMFGFSVYQSYMEAETTGRIPLPMKSEAFVGGHAVVAIGYDDTISIKNSNPGAPETVGALLIRNSWGTGWGESGYGWLPYEYVLSGLAVDWWSLIKSEWVDSEQFG